MLKLWKTPVLNKKVLAKALKEKNLAVIQKFNFSAGGHGHDDHGHSEHSGSGSDHEHHDDHEDHEHHEEDHGDHPIVPEGNFREEERSRIFGRQETFSVDSLLSSMRSPFSEPVKKYNEWQTIPYSSETEYINFLAHNFEKKALEKYPNYKIELDQYKHLIPNYETLNAYQKEVYALDTYLHWQLEVEELKIRETYNFAGTPLQRSRERFAFFQKLMAEDHHHDTRVMHHLKEKLREVLQKELEYEEFKHQYNETIESRLIDNIVENRKKTFYYEIAKNKSEINKHLVDLNSPQNKHKHYSSISPHDHIHPQHFHQNPEKINEEKWKYLAYFDIIIDQHLRQIRPSSISEYEEMFKYVKEENKPLKFVENHMMDNMYYDMLYTLDNEFYVKFKEEVQKTYSTISTIIEVEDKNRPTGRLWKEEHKFPHVADRIGWDFLQETPHDKNPFIERVESHPGYQFQAFVQVPSWEPNKDLCLEEGETIYENKYVYEWILFWKIVLALALLPLWILVTESYNNNTPFSPEYLSRFAYIHPANQTFRGLPRRQIERLLYWGSSLWTWQICLRKGLLYFTILTTGVCLRHVAFIGNEYVLKAVFNREKDLVFVWRLSGYFRKQLHVYELHYLEQIVPKAVSSWKDLGNFKSDGIFTVEDLRLDDSLIFYNDKKYWNIDERDYFFKNTLTFWRGLRHRDLNRGIWFNNSEYLNEEEYNLIKKINNEIKKSIEKHGPIAVTDYDYNYKYQMKKRILDIKRNLIEGKNIDTSIYREKSAGKSHEEHEHNDGIVRHALH